jgi:hypothetical protein
VFKALCKLQVEGLPIEAPDVAKDVAIGLKVPHTEILAGVLQIVSVMLADTQRWIPCTLAHRESEQFDCDEMPATPVAVLVEAKACMKGCR